MSKDLYKYHRFLDEAGDTTFYGKGKIPIIGNEGVSKCFLIGMVKFKEPLEQIRLQIIELKEKVIKNSYFQNVPSIQKKIIRNSFYFHATDDLPEVRMMFFELINGIDCSFEAVVGRKIPAIFNKNHNSKDNLFYADLLSHLLKNKFASNDKLVLNIAERGSSTSNRNLESALTIAKDRFGKNSQKEIVTKVAFNIQNHTNEPLLNIADYFCWSVQRVFERGEMRFYNYLSEKISLIIDLYDSSKYSNWNNYYNIKNKLTKDVMIK